MDRKEFSCIKQVIKTVQIPLPATFISNEISGIAEILESWKRQYKKELQGVLVNYKNYSLASSNGFIAPNKPFVFYNITATFDLFCPNIGQIVSGKINRISKEHVGCLIEDTINVTIHLTKDSSQELAPFIYLNGEILFEITYFSYDRKMIRVTGKITPRCIHLMKDLFPPPTFHNSVHTPELSNNTDEGIGTSSESTDEALLNQNFGDSDNNNDGHFKKPLLVNKKPKKKSSKKSVRESESSSMDTSDITSDDKPKKKKKHKDKSSLDIGNHFSAMSLSSDSIPSNSLSNTSAPNEKRKSSKKRKRENESSFIDTSEQSTADEMPKKKKKRKDKTVPFSEMEIKDEIVDDIVPPELAVTHEMPKKKKKHKDKSVLLLKNDIKDEIDDNGNAVCVKTEILSPVKTLNSTDPEKKLKTKDKKPKDKSKSKKSKDKNKSKKNKGKVLASGAVLKKDKKLRKKGSKKSDVNHEPSKKHKKGKSNKKDKSEKKKKKSNSKNKVSDVIKSEVD